MPVSKAELDKRGLLLDTDCFYERLNRLLRGSGLGRAAAESGSGVKKRGVTRV